MIAGEIIQSPVSVRGDVDPVVVDQDEGLSRPGGIGPDVGFAGLTNAAIGRAGPDAVGLDPGAIAEQDRLAGPVFDVRNAGFTVAIEDAVARWGVHFGSILAHRGGVTGPGCRAQR